MTTDRPVPVAPSPVRGSGALAAGAVLGWFAAAFVLVGLVLVAGDDMALLQLDRAPAVSPLAGYLAAAAAALLLAATSTGCAARLARPGGPWPGALGLAGLGLLVLAGLVAVALAAQASLGISVADLAGVSGATSEGQVVALVVGLVLGVAGLVVAVLGATRSARARPWG